jgi:F-type H+-transporting ATPase subunit gamma
VQLVLLTSDRGLAGAFNSNLVKAAQQFMAERPGVEQVEIEAVGRKGRDFFRRRTTLTGEHLGIFDKAKYADAAAIAQKVAARYVAGEIDAVYLLFQEFRSVISQKISLQRILPIALPEQGAGAIEYIYEQPPMELLEALLPRYIETAMYRAILESAASEYAARMTAMDAATSNAADVIAKLTLYMNRVRQASITREIIEVVSGAAALE